MDFQKFYMGEIYDAYAYLGAHLEDGGVVFRTFAPAAEKVAVIGEFNGWQETEMRQTEHEQFWQVFVPGAKEGQMYKYVIYHGGNRVEHCDPYGFGMELRPNFASIIRDLDAYAFRDSAWMERRTRNFDRPLNIYELHLGSWRRKDGFEDNPDKPVEKGWYRYDEIADQLIPYLKENHYTHVEFMPLAEHPFDGSWGYQITGFFAPTARYGTAEQLQQLIDRLHQSGIGAILDFVPAHFAMDWYALRRYDGTELYEYPSSDVSDSEWGSCNFIFSRREVACFMQSAGNYWLTKYHFDGLRYDAVSRIIYWMGDERRGVNDVAVDFLRKMNAGLHRLHPTAMLIAEDSTSFEGCTKPAEQGGIGFDYKWDLGWMNDTLDYFEKQSFERAQVPQKLTFSMFYYYRERYLLPLSHDEVVHGKRTIIDKMFGDYDMKFPQARAFYLYMYVHPGKKLNFMGNEIAQFREWDENRQQDWFLTKYPIHDAFHHFCEELNGIYEKHLALYAGDYDPAGFLWLTMNENGSNVYGVRRKGDGETVFAYFNFSDAEQHCRYTAVDRERIATLIDTDWQRFGGSTPEPQNKDDLMELLPGQEAELVLPAFSGILCRVETF
ncbi:MAG: 1,4-alpha-glucan branching protein GlgB [Lachnospiraceae bacterium]|nr:1,4-alpha-glucan branching protein GlgB [Lachnospiraceae bacterium]MCI1397722.1 1,4-alpha-glucan branching protein GlgB [Lachnospiraceae bacterium]MCI1423832.1 1,4-alpha-glucan branching protein GlgB [Lachnospiraceae bacterium]MCI1452628.1 1,4-alpha-glucan branching protein GlgB [Lachnospiraceae bacterium]